MAAIDLLSSVPPHIQPPIAQVPSPTAEARMPDEPISRVSISCDMLQTLHGFRTAPAVSSSTTSESRKRPLSAARIGQHLLGAGRDADGARALRQFGRIERDEPRVERIVGDACRPRGSGARGIRRARRCSTSSSRSGFGERMQVVVARSRRQDRADADQRDRRLARQVEHLPDRRPCPSACRAARGSRRRAARGPAWSCRRAARPAAWRGD